MKLNSRKLVRWRFDRSLEGTPFAAREEGSGEDVLGLNEFLSAQLRQYSITRPFLACGEGCAL